MFKSILFSAVNWFILSRYFQNYISNFWNFIGLILRPSQNKTKKGFIYKKHLCTQIIVIWFVLYFHFHCLPLIIVVLLVVHVYIVCVFSDSDSVELHCLQVKQQNKHLPNWAWNGSWYFKLFYIPRYWLKMTWQFKQCYYFFIHRLREGFNKKKHFFMPFSITFSRKKNYGKGVDPPPLMENSIKRCFFLIETFP